jgi:DmsE family decaheme c-type cytochrome
MFLMNLFSILGIAVLLFLLPAMSETQTQESEMSKETQVCSACHEDLVEAFTLNPHAVLDSKDLAQKAGAESSCVSCHGDPAEHLKSPGQGTIFAFKAEDLIAEKTQKCQTCHKDSNPRFFLSPHAKTGMDCTSCHNVHSGNPARSQLSTDNVSETCRDCHLEAFAKFYLNERHRLQEGILECTSCHNPHEPSTRTRLAGFKQAECFECHTDKQGPFVFEHGSVLIEGCTSCHQPHGSVNRHMLTFQKVGNLCYSCHVAVPSFHSRFTAETYCTDCHSTIHGSNLSPVFLE